MTVFVSYYLKEHACSSVERWVQMPKVLPYGSRVAGVDPSVSTIIVIQPSEIVRFFCELLKTAAVEGADAQVRKAKARALKDGLEELRAWETFLGAGFFADCADPLSLITTDIRWDNQLNKFVVLGFIDYLLTMFPNYYDPNPSKMPAKTIKLQPFWSKEDATANVQLSWYGLYADGATERSYPVLQLGDPNGLTIKTEVAYPNITLSRQRARKVMQRKSDFLMRYEPYRGSAKLLPAPMFDLTTNAAGDYEVSPQMRDIAGTPLKFAWLELGEAIKSLVRGAVVNLAELNSGDFAEDRYAWGAFAPENKLRKERQNLRDVFNLAERSKVLFDLACLFANECVQFIMPSSITKTKDGRALVDSPEAPTYSAYVEFKEQPIDTDDTEAVEAARYVARYPLILTPTKGSK